jgi:hypothetical protein
MKVPLLCYHPFSGNKKTILLWCGYCLFNNYRFPGRYYGAILIPRFKERRKEKRLWCRKCYLSPEGARFRDDPASDNEIEVALASNNNNNIIINDVIAHESVEVSCHFNFWMRNFN